MCLTDIEMSETLGNENVFPKSPSVRARIFFLLFDSVNVILLEMLRCETQTLFLHFLIM